MQRSGPNANVSKAAHWWAALLCRRPRFVLLVALILAALGMALAATQLKFNPSRNDLISTDLDWNQRFVSWRQRFPGSHDLLVIADTGPDGASRAQAQQFIHRVAELLADDPVVQRVDYGAPASDVSPKAARLLPTSAFRAVLDQSLQAQPLLASQTPSAFLAALTSALVNPQSNSEPLDAATSPASGIDRLAGFVAALAPPEDSTSSTTQLDTWFASQQAGLIPTSGDWRFLESPNHRFLLMRLALHTTEGKINELAPSIAHLRSILDQARAQSPGLRAGLTGIEAIETDETSAVMRDSVLASSIAFLAIALILITAFHSIRTPVLIVLSLLVGVAWSFGYLTLVVGHLQILSVVFVVILLGLGVDFGIHLAATLETLRHDHAEESFADALTESLEKIGPGVVTGALTTSAAFFITAFTDFRGVAEMGLIAGGGILLCLISMLSVLPALKAIFSSSHEHIRPLSDRSFHMYKESWSMPFVRAPGLTLLSIGGLLVVLGFQATQIRFDYNLPALLPRGIPSVYWQQQLTRQGDVSLWNATCFVENLDQARSRKAKLLALPSVASVGGIGLLIPDDEPAKLDLIRQTTQAFSPASRSTLAEPQVDSTADITPLSPQLALLAAGARQALARDDLPADIRAAAQRLLESTQHTATALSALSPADLARHQHTLDNVYKRARSRIATAISSLLDSTPLGPTDLPPPLLRGSIATDGSGYALTVRPHIPSDSTITSPLDPRILSPFIRDVRSIDPNVTGIIVQIERSGDLIRRSFLWAGGAAFIVVLAIVWIMFRSLIDSLLSLAPVMVAFLITFGTMTLLGQSLNAANVIVLPLLFGVGVDAGVHIIHRYRENPVDRPLGLTAGTGKGITVTSLTTIAGFAAMMLAQHRGIASLGFVLTLGISVTMLASWTILPALLELRERRHTRAAPPQA